MTDELKFLEFLSRNHILPSFNLPIDAVPFVARTTVGGDEFIVARMSDGLEKALNSYAPGKEVTYKKKEFVVGGIYIEYMPRQDVSGEEPEEAARIRTNEVINRTRLWFDSPGNINYFHMCKVCSNTLDFNSTLPEEVEELRENCKVCDEKDWISLPTIRPPGFAPLIRQTSRKGFSEVDNPTYSQDTKQFFNRTKWPSSLIQDGEPEVFALSDFVEINYHQKIKILDVNAGFGDVTDPANMGYAFCKDCGHMSPFKSIKTNHLRPYAITNDDGMFSGAYNYESTKEIFQDQSESKCSSTNNQIGESKRLLLGRLFTTNVMSMKIKWQDNWVALDEEGRKLGRRCATTLCHALLQAITTADTKFVISPNDLGGDIRQTEGFDGFEVFIYERVDGGAGLLKDVFELIRQEFRSRDERGTILDKLYSILSGKQCVRSEKFRDEKSRLISIPCNGICQGCLQDFSTQHLTAELDRELGYQYLELSLDSDHSQNFNFTSAAKNLNFLAQQSLLQQGLERPLELVIDPDNKAFEILAGQEPIAPEDEHIQTAFKGLEFGDSTLLITCELIDDSRQTSFTPTEVNRNPLETIKRLSELCQETTTRERRI